MTAPAVTGLRERLTIEQAVARGWSAAAIAEHVGVSVETVHAVWDELDADAVARALPVPPGPVVGVNCCERHRSTGGRPETPPEWFVDFRSACSELGSIELACLALGVSVRAAEGRWQRHHPQDPMRFRLSHEVSRQVRLLEALEIARAQAVAA